MKKSLLLIVLYHLFTHLSAQNNILRGVITVKGEDHKPLKGASVVAIGVANKAYTDDNGFYELVCKGMGAGDVLTLIVQKEKYVVLDKNALQQVVLRKQANMHFNIVMQEESTQKAEIELAEKRITNNINKQFDAQKADLNNRFTIIETKLQQSTLNEIERKLYQDSIARINIDLKKISEERDIALKLVQQTAEQLNFFDAKKASKEGKYADSLYKAGDLIGAYNALDEGKMKQRAKAAKELLAQTVSDYMQKGNLAIINGKFADAERLYISAIALDSINLKNLNVIALFLHKQQKVEDAIVYYEKALKIAKNQRSIASLCNNLGNSYMVTQKPTHHIEAMYLRALNIYLNIVDSNTVELYTDLGATLTNLGIFYNTNKRMDDAERMYLHALDIYQQGIKLNQTYLYPNLGKLSMSLGNFYSDNKKIHDAEKIYLIAIEIYEHLVRDNYDEFEPDLAKTATNLGNLYSNISDKIAQSEDMHLRALEIYKRFVKKNSIQFEPDLALVMINLGVLYYRNNRISESTKMYLGSLEIYERFIRNGFLHFKPNLAVVLMNLGNIYKGNHLQIDEAEQFYLRCLEIRESLFKNNPTQFEPDIATICINLGSFYLENKPNKEKSLEFIKRGLIAALKYSTKDAVQSKTVAVTLLNFWSEDPNQYLKEAEQAIAIQNKH